MLHAVGLSLISSFRVLTIHSIFEQFDPLSPEDRDQCCVSLEQEVLLSYRFLFGQDGNSKKVACEELCSLKNKYPNQNDCSMFWVSASANTIMEVWCGQSHVGPWKDISRKAPFTVFEMTSQGLLSELVTHGIGTWELDLQSQHDIRSYLSASILSFLLYLITPYSEVLQYPSFHPFLVIPPPPRKAGDSQGFIC